MDCEERKDPAPEETLIDPVWDYEAVLCDPENLAWKLKEPATKQSDITTIVGEPVLGAEPQWEDIRLVTLRMKGFDREGKRVSWFKSFWKPWTQTLAVKKEWKFFMNGLRAAFKMLRVGEKAWFAINPEGQKCDYIIGYPTRLEPIYALIELVDASTKKKADVPKNLGYDIIGQYKKIKNLKAETDEQYRKHWNHQLGVAGYTKVLNKLTGLMNQLKKQPEEETPMLPDVETDFINVQNNLALSYINSKDPEKALPLLEAVLAKSPENQKALMRKGYCLEALNSLDESLLFFKQAKDMEGITRVQNKIKDRNQKMWVQLQKKGLFDSA